MAIEVRLTPKARKDLASIHMWTWKRFGSIQANKYVSDIATDFNLIADQPELARDASDIRPNLRKSLSGSHVIFYRISERSLTVVRILHGNMDFGRWL